MRSKRRTLSFDARGRITVPAALRRGLGKEFIAIRMPDGIELRPVPRHVHVPVPAAHASGEQEALGEA